MGKLYIPDHRILEDAANPTDVVRYDVPYKADLVRKMVGAHKELDDSAMGPRTFDADDYTGGATGPYTNYITHDGDEIYSNEGDTHSRILGPSTPTGQHIYQLEDRVKVAGEEGTKYFDQLPEVKDLQYRLSALPVINHILKQGKSPEESDQMFRDYKKSLQKDPDSDYILPSPQPGGKRTYHGFAYFPKESFVVKHVDPRENDEDWSTYYQREQDPTIHDPFKEVHDNISEKYGAHKDERIEDHLNALTNSYNTLWDKLESGMYRRHPKFWGQHSFSSFSDRDSCWKQLQSLCPELKIPG